MKKRLTIEIKIVLKIKTEIKISQSGVLEIKIVLKIKIEIKISQSGVYM